MTTKKIHISEIKSIAHTLKAGDSVLLSGTVYTARDAAHMRMFKALREGGALPFDFAGAAVYYAGPTPSRPGQVIGSCGPTTSSRMDAFAPEMLDMGLAAMIGKGPRSEEVRAAIARNGAVYFCAVGGAGAIAAKSIVSCEVIAYDDLGCESVKKMEFCDFPLIVAIDADGNSLFQ